MSATNHSAVLDPEEVYRRLQRLVEGLQRTQALDREAINTSETNVAELKVQRDC